VSRKTPKVLNFKRTAQLGQVSRELARELVATGEFIWCDGSRNICQARPDSPASPACLGRSDSEALAGRNFRDGFLGARQRERLLGHFAPSPKKEERYA
jgi:hypothetical protein